MTGIDVIIIGAGPAGLEAARVAAEGGLQVLLLDDQPQPGGQIYRNVSLNGNNTWLGPDYFAGASLVAGLAQPSVSHMPGATVWRIEDEGVVYWSRSGVSHLTRAPQIILATGAMERPMPFPGWTLPGVMPAGAA
jgi:NADPH-dependent 2,4-dienoyl-CoA reductase/sulfur reductase-like enzyme